MVRQLLGKVLIFLEACTADHAAAPVWPSVVSNCGTEGNN